MEGKDRSKEAGEEAVVITQEGNDGRSEQRDSSGDGERCLDSGYILKVKVRGTRMAQSVKHPTLDFSSGYVGLVWSLLGILSLSLSLSAPPLHVYPCVLSLSLSKNKLTNK